jgi:hypothetical protein
MSKFKTNSRFGSLVENNSNSKEFKNNKVGEQSTTEKRCGDNNSFKKNTNRYERADDYCARRAKEENFKKEEERRLKEENTIKSLAPESFPDLISKPVNFIPPNYTSFSEKLQSLVINNNDDKIRVDLDYKNLSQGWSLIKRDEKTNKIIIKKKEPLGLIHIDESDGFKILDAFVELHEKRNNEYIDMWGYEEWEHMFKFPNYDYDYFDRLDELYYQEMENEESEEDVDYDEYINDYDKLNNYWNN